MIISNLAPNQFLVNFEDESHVGEIARIPLADRQDPKLVLSNDKIETAGGVQFGKGLIPRDYSKEPLGCKSYAPVGALPLIPRSEWPERIKDLRAKKQLLRDIRDTSGPNGGPIKSLDQNGQGYCWFYSTTSAATLLRAKLNFPYVRFSAHMGAWIIKNGRNEGGWNLQSLEFWVSTGCCSVEFWPEKSMDGRTHKNEAALANAALHKILEWEDIKDDLDTRMTYALNGIPVMADRMDWAHSTCDADPVDVNPGKDLADDSRWGNDTWNSWTDNWGNGGWGVIAGNRRVNGAAAPRYINPSIV